VLHAIKDNLIFDEMKIKLSTGTGAIEDGGCERVWRVAFQSQRGMSNRISIPGGMRG
jgi:hypothetical protein